MGDMASGRMYSNEKRERNEWLKSCQVNARRKSRVRNVLLLRFVERNERGEFDSGRPFLSLSLFLSLSFFLSFL